MCQRILRADYPLAKDNLGVSTDGKGSFIFHLNQLCSSHLHFSEIWNTIFTLLLFVVAISWKLGVREVKDISWTTLKSYFHICIHVNRGNRRLTTMLCWGWNDTSLMLVLSIRSLLTYTSSLDVFQVNILIFAITETAGLYTVSSKHVRQLSSLFSEPLSRLSPTMGKKWIHETERHREQHTLWLTHHGNRHKNSKNQIEPSGRKVME